MGLAATVRIGVDLGQRTDPTAIVVVEALARARPPVEALVEVARGVWREPPREEETVFAVRDLGRLLLGTSYPRIEEHLIALLWRLRERGIPHPKLVIDATGATAATNDLRAALQGFGCDLVAATFTHGDQVTRQPGGAISVGKAFLVNRLQVLLQGSRLALPPNNQEASVMARELLEYEIKVAPDANDHYGAFRVGTHDDLVTALGLAVLDDGDGAWDPDAAQLVLDLGSGDRTPWA